MKAKQKTLRERVFYPMLGTATIAVAIEILSLLTDNIIVGHVVGETGVAGINLVTPAFSFCAFLGGVIVVGVSFRYADAIGRFEEERAGRLFGMGILLAAGVGVVMCLAAFLFDGLYFDTLSPSAPVRAAGEAYFQFIRLNMLVHPGFVLLAEMVYNDGDTGLCNVAYVVQMAGNVGLSILLCLRMGAGGASLGTLIGTTAGLCVLLLHFFKKSNGLKPRVFFSLRELAVFFRYGFTDAGMYLCWSILFYLLNGFMIRRFGDETLPALAVVIGFFELTVIFDGIGQAMKPLVSVYSAEQNQIGVHRTMKITLRCALAEGIAAAAAVFLLANVMPLAFNVRDPATLALSALALRMIAPSMVAISILYLYSSYYLNVGQIGLSVWLMLWKDLLSILPLSVLLGLAFGVRGVWAGILLAPFLTLLIWRVTVRFRFVGEEFPLLLESDRSLADFDLCLCPEEIMAVRREAEDFLRARGASGDAIAGAKLLIEDLSQLVMEQNPPERKVFAEWTIRTGERSVLIIYRDNGAVADLSDPDGRIASFRGFILSSVAENLEMRKYLMTTGMNRAAFQIPYDWNSERSHNP